MKILGFSIGEKKEAQVIDIDSTKKGISKRYGTHIMASSSNGSWGNSYSISFDGEKNLGEMGPIKNYQLNHKSLAMRSWQSYLESDISKTVLDRFTLWVIDKGLKLNSNPLAVLLKSEGINIKPETFNEVTEARFTIWAKSKYSSFNKMSSLNSLSKVAFKHAKIGGDVLVVIRYDGTVNVQVIDTAHLVDPYGYEMPSGNKIIDGVEIDKSTGEHIAFHIRKPGKFETERIPAYNSIGMKTAFLVYGDTFRVDNVRGIPIIATALETLKKIERYKEAVVGSAEERQKIAYFIEHEIGSTGESPLASQIAMAFDADATGENIPIDATGQSLANNVAATANKQTYNMPIGSTIKQLESRNELFFKEFYESNANIICAAVGIPPNVAFSLYNDSFSASRAATKDWEHTIEVERDNFMNQFYAPIYSFWLMTEILNNKIQAPGYLAALTSGNWMINEAYHNARFTGPMFPHIDPLKEVEAERLKLGSTGAAIPLTTVEQATEQLNGGDSDSNLMQYAEELQTSKDLGVKIDEPVVKPGPKTADNQS